MDNFKQKPSNQSLPKKSIDGFIVKTSIAYDHNKNVEPINDARIGSRISSQNSNKTNQFQNSIVDQKLVDQVNISQSSLVGMTLPTNYINQQTNRSRRQQRIKKKWTIKRLVFGSILIIVLAMGGVGGFLVYRGVSTVDKVFHGNIVSDVTAPFSSAPLKGENSGRVNILLAGDSVDDPNHGGATLTDSMIVLSLNTKTKAAFLLSIPRDLWVYIPGLSSYQKINAANDVTNF